MPDALRADYLSLDRHSQDIIPVLNSIVEKKFLIHEHRGTNSNARGIILALLI